MKTRIQQIQQEIDAILASPLPPYPERYIPREALHALVTEKLTLEGFAAGDARQIDLEARRFAIEKVPQNLFSYPISQRETRIMAVDPNYLKEYASRPTQPPMNLEEKQKGQAKLTAPWNSLPVSK